ncbi:trichohyalin-like [Asterias rubens]|uniref:trichohyalin-like n=1 Tax=Asterias rubens TaxID=7604 RepID=UPI001455C624|nr:trichohyalin-like [Asterias rubens]
MKSSPLNSNVVIMTSHRRQSSSSDDSSSSASSSRSSSPATAVPKAYARLENDSEQVQTLVDREKEKMYRKRPYSVSLSSGSEVESSPESNIPKAYSRKKTKKKSSEDGNSWKSTTVPSSSSSSSSSDSSSSSSSSSDSSSDSEPEHNSQNQHKKNLSSKDLPKDNRSSQQHRSNNQNENSSRKVHEGGKKLQQRREKSRGMVAQSPEEIRHKKREVEDKPRSSRHTEVARRSYSQEIHYRDSRGRIEDKTQRHRVDRELRRDQEPIRDDSGRKNNHREKDVKRDGSQSEKDRRYYDRLKEMPRNEGSNSRQREEEQYKGGDAPPKKKRAVPKASSTAHKTANYRSRNKSSRERDRRKLMEVSKKGYDHERVLHERVSPAEVHSRSKARSSKETERQRVKQEMPVCTAGREYFSTERGCWEWEPAEEPGRKAPDDPRDHQASHRRQNSREDGNSRHSVRESSYAEKHHKMESLEVDSRRTAHSSPSPAKIKSDSRERRKKKMERAKEKERAKLKKEKRKRREKLERRKEKKKERREHRSKKSKEKRHKERRERRSKEPKVPKISNIQAKLLNLASGVQEAAPRILAPMTKEEYERKQSRTRRVYDEDTGRHRLVRGDGEIIEEIVSRDRHRQINKQATRGDGIAYQRSLGLHRY